MAPNGDAHALAGLACFMRERYEDAAKHYARAVRAGGKGIDDWRKMQALAGANAKAEIYVEVAKPVYFDRDELLDAPKVRDGDLPRPLAHRIGSAAGENAVRVVERRIVRRG